MDLAADLKYLHGVIGGWPPRVNGILQRWRIKRIWKRCLKELERLEAIESSQVTASVEKAELLRIGHNIDIPGAAERCQSLLDEILVEFPDNARAHYSLATLYVSTNPRLAGEAEKHFQQALQHSGSDQNPNVLQGLAFACLYQERFEDSIGYFEQYLRLANDSEVARLLANLKAGKRPTIHYVGPK